VQAREQRDRTKREIARDALEHILAEVGEAEGCHRTSKAEPLAPRARAPMQPEASRESDEARRACAYGACVPGCETAQRGGNACEQRGL
jgi:hypothetical protein